MPCARKERIRATLLHVNPYLVQVNAQMRGKEDLLMLLGDFAAISVTVRGCAGPISKVERHISERSCATLWCEHVFGP